MLGGQYGGYPSLDDPGFEADDDLKLTTDFRDIYGTILNKWLNVPVADLGPGTGKILAATPIPDGDGKNYTALTPLGYLPYAGGSRCRSPLPPGEGPTHCRIVRGVRDPWALAMRRSITEIFHCPFSISHFPLKTDTPNFFRSKFRRIASESHRDSFLKPRPLQSSAKIQRRGL